MAACDPNRVNPYNQKPAVADPDCPPGDVGCPCKEGNVCNSGQLKCSDSADGTCVQLVVNESPVPVATESGPDLGLIIGLSVVGVCVILIIILIIFMVVQHRKRRASQVNAYLQSQPQGAASGVPQTY
jgi:hypothetical protein